MAHLELRHILARGTMICQSAFIIHQTFATPHLLTTHTTQAAKEIDTATLKVRCSRTTDSYRHFYSLS